MPIPTIVYKAHELRAYSSQVFPPFRDPFAKGPRRFSSVVRIDTVPADDAGVKRYSTAFVGDDPARADEALDLALEFGKDIVDGKVQPVPL
jgi:hypothetical protein